MLIAPATFATFDWLVRARELLTTTDEPVAAIARTVRFSQSHMIRAVAALFGATPHELRTRARLDRAKQLLHAGTPVTDITVAASGHTDVHLALEPNVHGIELQREMFAKSIKLAILSDTVGNSIQLYQPTR